MFMETDAKIGLIGVAGTKFKSTYPTSSWGQSSFLRKYRRGHIYYPGPVVNYIDFDESQNVLLMDDVVCIDGVFMFTNTDVYKVCKFDSKTFNNFHGYDLDFSLQVFFQGYRIVVDRSIEIIHFSSGNYNVHFTNANLLIQKKWASKLPVASKDLGWTRFQVIIVDLINNAFAFKETLCRKIKNI